MSTRHRLWGLPLSLAAGAVLLAGCGKWAAPPQPTICGSRSQAGSVECPQNVNDRTPVPPGPGGDDPNPDPQPATIPAELIGSWSGDDAQGRGSWVFTFAQDGEFRLSNDRQGQQIHGRAAAKGSRMLLQPDNGASYTVAWSVGSGRLTVDGSVYLRMDDGERGGGATQALVGSWMDTTNYYTTLQFGGDGSVTLTDPVHGDASGSYDISGHKVTIALQGRGAGTYTWQIQNAMLLLRSPRGIVTEYTRV